MKQLIALVLCTVALISCEGPMGPPGERGERTHWFSDTYTVKSEDWQLVNGHPDELGTFYTYVFDERELTDFIYQEGRVSGYLMHRVGDLNVQSPLPFTIYQGIANSNGEELWEEEYSFDFAKGSIAFYFRDSGFITSNPPPTCTFRIVMTW